MAVTLDIYGAQGQPLFSAKNHYAAPMSVGEISIDFFENFEIPYQGSIYGITEIFGLGQDLEIISDTEMKAHGWCFNIDGVLVETMPDQTLIEDSATHIEWYYAYAHYLNGEWVAQCVRP